MGNAASSPFQQGQSPQKPKQDSPVALVAAPTTVLEDTCTPTRGPVHVSNIPADYESYMTLYTNLMRRKEVDDGSGRLFGARAVDTATGEFGAFQWTTFGEFLEDVEATSSGMKKDLNLQRADLVGVFSKNRYEWALVEHSCNRMTYTLVPLYDTLGPTAVPFMMNQTEMKVIFCAKEQFATLMHCVDECHHVETIIQFEDVDDEQREEAKAKNVVLKSLSELRELGKSQFVPEEPPLPSDLSTICYTSGTTGNPKGVMLTHANIVSSVGATYGYSHLNTEDVHLSYLPLAHIFERVIQTMVIGLGGSVGFYQGSSAKILDDLAELQPTIFPSVPRLLNRVYDKITQGVNNTGGLKKIIFDRALAAKKAGLATGQLTHSVWDPLVFNKVKRALGGRVRLMMNGSAPISSEVKEFLQVAVGCPVLEGYGLTEASACISCSIVAIAPGNHVGIPLSGVQVRLADVPDMEYSSNDTPRPRGEIVVKGPGVFAGYFKQPEATAEVLDADGWLHTGDIGAWNEDGTLSIIDRKKNIFKLAQGEYVAPEKIEGVYIKSQYVSQIYVAGHSLESYLVGVVVPDPDVAASWAAAQGLAGDDASMAALCQNAAFLKVVSDDMEETAKTYKLFRFERVQRLHLHPEELTLESNLVTPTFKLKRPQLAKHFKDQIDSMYAGPAPF